MHFAGNIHFAKIIHFARNAYFAMDFHLTRSIHLPSNSHFARNIDFATNIDFARDAHSARILICFGMFTSSGKLVLSMTCPLKHSLCLECPLSPRACQRGFGAIGTMAEGNARLPKKVVNAGGAPSTAVD